MWNAAACFFGTYDRCVAKKEKKRELNAKKGAVEKDNARMLEEKNNGMLEIAKAREITRILQALPTPAPNIIPPPVPPEIPRPWPTHSVEVHQIVMGAFRLIEKERENLAVVRELLCGSKISDTAKEMLREEPDRPLRPESRRPVAVEDEVVPIKRSPPGRNFKSEEIAPGRIANSPLPEDLDVRVARFANDLPEFQLGSSMSGEGINGAEEVDADLYSAILEEIFEPRPPSRETTE